MSEKKILSKELISAGINGAFKGLIEIHFGYRTEVKEVHNRSTHDEEKRPFVYHRVIGWAEGERFESEEFQNENLVWQFVDEVEKKVGTKLHQLANVPKALTLEEQLIQKGFKNS